MFASTKEIYMRQIRKRLTYANMMSSIAVFLVLGGAAYAASQLPRNSVGTKQLKNNAVTGAKVKNHSLTGQDIKLNALGTVPSATNATNATSAGNANTVGGQSPTKIFTKLANGAGPSPIATIAGFTLTASCPNAPSEKVVITLNSPTNVPSVMTAMQSSLGTTTEYNAGTNISIRLDNSTLGETSFSAATTTGTVISGNIGYDYPDTFSSENICVVYGEVFSG